MFSSKSISYHYLSLQDTYNLRPGDISEGKLSGKSYGVHLTSNDCFELGRQSYNNGDHAHTVQVA